MDRMKGAGFFQCDRCHIECRIDSEAKPSTAPLIIHHCPESRGIPFLARSPGSKNGGAVSGWT